MSLSATYPDRATSQRTDTRPLLFIIWAATVATYLIAGLRADESLSTDDAMRLVQVRDLLAGQNWFDPVQYRLDPPLGVAMHWSRLIDLPIAALIRAGTLVLPQALAERIATMVWPAALLLLFLAGVARLARGLGGNAAAGLALLFAALMGPVLQHFRPGAIDHHNAQLVVLIWTLALTACTTLRPRNAAIGGALCAMSLAIGQEMVPAVAAISALVALRWIFHGDDAKQATAAFGFAFTAATLALFAATISPARYAVAACDALSIVQVTVAAVGGLGLAGLSATPGLSTTGRRLLAAAGLGALLAATLIFAFPACLGDPLGPLDPRLVELWLAHVTEARSIVSMLHDLPQDVLAYYGLPAAGFALGLVRCLRERGDQRWPWIVGTAVLTALSIVAAWEVRAAAAANAVAIALVPAALVRGLQRQHGGGVFLGLGRAVLLAALLLNPLALIAVGSAATHLVESISGTQPPTVIADGPGTCRRTADYAPLARLPRGLVLAFIDAGPFLLMETPHAVLAAPYHRDVKGNAAMFDIFLGTPSDAAARIAALGVDYVAFCPGAPDRYTLAASAPNGLVAVLGRGEVPDFLERVPLEGTDLAMFRTRR
jgi:hypothetical protein